MIKFFKQDLNKSIFIKALDNFKNDLWVNGKIINKFENNLKKTLKIQQKVSTCNSGSDALLLTLLLDKNSKKDIYITTPISYLASSSIPRFLGLNLIYIDVEKDGYIMCLKELEKFLNKCPIQIQKRLKGIINVELFGATCDLIKLKKIAYKNNLTLIGDCAQSLGAKYKNKPDGSFGDAAVFSFARNKPIATAGTHGALVWDDDSLTTIIHAVSNNGKLGRDSKIQAYGINAVPMELQAAQIDIGLDHMGEWQVKRKSIHQYYVEQFKNLPLEIIHANDYCESNYHKFALKTNQRNELYKHCQKNNIQALLHYTDNFSDYFGSTKVFPNTDAFCETVITLPNHSWMTDAEIETVANTVKEFYI